MSTPHVIIKPKREKPILNQHPWIFSGAIAHAESATDGDIVTVQNSKGEFLARGYWNHRSQIQVRVLTWVDEPIDEDWWRIRLRRAIQTRKPYYLKENRACRLVNAENDFLPGLIVDRYANFLVLQALTLHIDQQKHNIAQWLIEILSEFGIAISGIYERNDVDVRGKEGLLPETGILLGNAPPDKIQIDAPFPYLVDVHNGHKTGHYLDQIGNQIRFPDFIQAHFTSEQKQVLNLFSYTGGFGVAALQHPGTVVINVDSSAEALALAEENIRLNHHPEDAFENIQADAFDYLHYCVNKGIQYDAIVVDPPKFAHRKQQIERASRGYKNLNLNAFKIIRSGGYLMTFSCSGAISRDLFQKIVFGALADSGRQAQIIQHLGANDDHPIALSFPEGEYLKGLLLRVY